MINRIIKLLLVSVLVSSNSFAAVYNSTQEASTYVIQIARIQFCETGSTAANCLNPAEIYQGESGNIDIASTTAGEQAAGLGNASKAVIGKTYTYMQVTLNRAVTISGGGSATSKSGEACYTNGTDGTAAQNALGNATSSNEAEATVYMAIAGTTDNGNNINSVSAADGSGTVAAAGAITSGHEYMEWRGALTKPFTLTQGQLPTVTIAFGTSAALGFYNPDTDNNACATRAGGATTTGFYAAEPDVTITIE